MYEGLDRCRELIKELQSTQTFEQNDQQKLHDDKIRVVESQRLQDDKFLQEDRLCEILNSLEGKTVCGTLDLLSKVSSVLFSYRSLSSRIIFSSLSPGTGEIRG